MANAGARCSSGRLVVVIIVLYFEILLFWCCFFRIALGNPLSSRLAKAWRHLVEDRTTTSRMALGDLD